MRLNTLKASAWSAAHALGYEIHKSQDLRSVALLRHRSASTYLSSTVLTKGSMRSRGGQVDTGEKFYRLNR